uniref:NCK associated protein 5 n=1 Tax=Ornithorhynchus anatinus TaxID=9258 RepID=A0A6I8NI98_ORNAN
MEGRGRQEKRNSGKRFSQDGGLAEYRDSGDRIQRWLIQMGDQARRPWRENPAGSRRRRQMARSRSEGAMHERLILELEEERGWRLQSEKRLWQVTLEAERGRAQIRGLQEQFARMEGTVRSLLDQLEPAGWRRGAPLETLALQDKERDVFILKEQTRKKNLEDLEAGVFEAPENEGKNDSGENEKTTLMLSRLKALEAENLALALENENQREQYERCLDEVANQVVQALLTQKDLRKKCVKLKARVSHLEEQNRALSVLLQQRIRPACDLLLQECLLSTACRLPASTTPGPWRSAGLGRGPPRSSCNDCSSCSEPSPSGSCNELSSGSSRPGDGAGPAGKRDEATSPGFTTREKRILEGLRRLQRPRPLPLPRPPGPPPDGGVSNEGIYSPGPGAPGHRRATAFPWDPHGLDPSEWPVRLPGVLGGAPEGRDGAPERPERMERPERPGVPAAPFWPAEGTGPETFSFPGRRESTRRARGGRRRTTPGDAEGGGGLQPGANTKAAGGVVSGRAAEAPPAPPWPRAAGIPLLTRGGAGPRAGPGGGSGPPGDEAQVRGQGDPTASPQDPRTSAPTSGPEDGGRKGSTTTIRARRSPSPQGQEAEEPTTGASSGSSPDAGISGRWGTPGPGPEAPPEGPKPPRPGLEPPSRTARAQISKIQVPGPSLRPSLTGETRPGGLAKARSPSPQAAPRPTRSDPPVDPAGETLARAFPTAPVADVLPPGPGGKTATEPGGLHPPPPSCPGRVLPPPQEAPTPRVPPGRDVRPPDPGPPDSPGVSSARGPDAKAGPGPLRSSRPVPPSPGSPWDHGPGPQVSPRRAPGRQGQGKCPPPLRPGPDKREKDTVNAVARTEASAGRTPHREGAARPARGPPPGPVSPDPEPPLRSRGTGWAQRPPRPALGTHAAKARGQGRAARPDDRTDPAGPGRSRTQIITSAADRWDTLPGPGRDPGTPKLPTEGRDPSPPDWAVPGRPNSPRGRPSREPGPRPGSGPEAPRSPPAGRGEAGGRPRQPDPPPPHRGPEGPPPPGAGPAPSMEERVMRGIRENPDPPPPGRAGPRAAPSIAGWFGFRRSRLPGLGGRGPRPARREEDEAGLPGRRPKPERSGAGKGPEREDEAGRDEEVRDHGGGDLGATKWLVTAPAPPGPGTGLPARPPSTTKDAFLKELLNRVDRKAGLRTESGSRDVSFGGSSGPGPQPFPRPSRCLGPSGSPGEDGNEKSGLEMPLEARGPAPRRGPSTAASAPSPRRPRAPGPGDGPPARPSGPGRRSGKRRPRPRRARPDVRRPSRPGLRPARPGPPGAAGRGCRNRPPQVRPSPT